MKKDIALSLVITLVLMMFINYFQDNSTVLVDDSEIKITEQQKVIPQKFGIKSEDFNKVSAQIEPGMFLGNLFRKFDVSRNKLTEILQKTKDVFDVRKIKRGNSYHAFLSKDSVRNLEHLVYEINKIDYVVFNLKDSISVQRGSRKIDIKNKKAGSVIDGALWFAMQDAGINPLMSNELSSIYAWTVDFFALQKGDKFKILYSEKYVDGENVGTGNIEAAFFTHRGQKIYAIPFKQDSIMSFYNIDGSALKKAFLKAPVSYSRISSGFSNARLHPILKIVRPHHGVDYAAPSGTPVYALGDGTVIHASYTGGAGNYIKIKHNSVYTTGYMHLRGYAKGIHNGARVKQGQLIGFVGSTGLSTGAHLDFRVWKNGSNINPLKIDAPPVEPIKTENMVAFNEVMKKYKLQLDQIVIKTKPESDSKLIAENIKQKYAL